MAWMLLFIAGLFEAIWAFSMKQSEGFTRLWPTVSMLAAMTASIVLLTIAMRTLPLGTAYSVWTGIGVLSALILGTVALGEQMTAVHALGAGFILAGIVLLRTAS